MHEINIEQIRKHLLDKEVQARVARSMVEARSKATVTISRAAGLFGFSESQLREWEKRGLLKTKREDLPEDSKATKGHRQFSPDGLDKLALIKELLDRGYSISEIPQNVDDIWEQVTVGKNGQTYNSIQMDGKNLQEAEHLSIDKRVENVDQETFWRYFISQALRLSLLLICENVPNSIAGLVLPLQGNLGSSTAIDTNELNTIGLSLIGWLSRTRTFYSFLDNAPAFEFPTDFRIEPLLPVKKHNREYVPLLILQRDSRLQPLKESVLETIHRLLELVYRYSESWQPFFENGMRDWAYQVTDFRSDPTASDIVLDRLMDMVVALGGETPEGQGKWLFCNLFVPQDTSLPLLQRNLVVRANSTKAPMEVSVMGLSVTHPGLTFKAYQSGHIVYRPKVKPPDIAYLELESSTHSAIAIPVAGEDGLPIAALYISSDKVDAFSVADQRALRFISRMIEELFSTYQARRHIMGKLSNMIINPGLVDVSFRSFLSDNEFVNDLEELLEGILTQELNEQQAEETVSFIAIDIDKQSDLAAKYGDYVARNLSRVVGTRIQGHLRIWSEPELRKVYHLSADRYYLFLKGVSLEEARVRAANLQKVLVGEYLIDAKHGSATRPMIRERLLELLDVTVRLGVCSYTNGKLKEVLGRYSVETTLAETRAQIMRNLDESLDVGQREGGNCIISWDPDPDIWGYRRWSQSEIN
jgi:DNA-binding transcriptional MerR regulator/GGDEF domain-containing protein